jgi:PAS domain S-box-containing protein
MDKEKGQVALEVCEEERQRQKAVLDNIGEVIYVSDPDTYELLYVNEAFKKKWGDAVGETCYQVLQNLDEPCPFCTNDRIFADVGEPYVWEFQNQVTGDWFRCIDRAIPWVDGRIVRYEMAIDITRQKEAEAELAQMKAVIANSADAIAIGGLEGHVTYANRACYEMFGYDRESQEMIGMPIADCWAAQDRARLQEVMPQVMGGEWRGEARQQRKDGETFEAALTVFPVQDDAGRPFSVAAIIRDITERKQAEQALRTTRASIDQARDAFYWFDEEGRFIDVNETTLEMLGYTREEILTLSVFDVDPSFPRETWPPLKEQLKEKGSLAFEGFNQTKGGVSIPVDVVVSYLQFGEQEIYFSIARDITEQKQAQEERERLQQEVIETQQQALKELSSPVIPIIDAPGGGGGVIVMPLIGSIDTIRARDITRRLLAGIHQHRAKVVILDITGVPVVDSGVANHLNKTVQAARLKGARTIVTGISDAVAETIVDLGIDWSGIETLADLQTGLIVALKNIGVGLRRAGS